MFPFSSLFLFSLRYFYKHAAETEILEHIEAAGGQGLGPEGLTSTAAAKVGLKFEEI